MNSKNNKQQPLKNKNTNTLSINADYYQNITIIMQCRRKSAAEYNLFIKHTKSHYLLVNYYSLAHTQPNTTMKIHFPPKQPTTHCTVCVYAFKLLFVGENLVRKKHKKYELKCAKTQ